MLKTLIILQHYCSPRKFFLQYNVGFKLTGSAYIVVPVSHTSSYIVVPISHTSLYARANYCLSSQYNVVPASLLFYIFSVTIAIVLAS